MKGIEKILADTKVPEGARIDLTDWLYVSGGLRYDYYESEGKGLSRLVSETCDLLVSIPMANDLESLNAGVAASVTLYSIAQARRTPSS